VSGDVEKWVEAGTQAIKEKNGDDATATEIHLGYISHDYLSDFILAACRAFLAAAEADGVVLVRVPEQRGAPDRAGRWWLSNLEIADEYRREGFNTALFDVLAGKVTV
jgi:hypothetical protein